MSQILMNAISTMVAAQDWVLNVTIQMVPTAVDAQYLDTSWKERTVKVKSKFKYLFLVRNV